MTTRARRWLAAGVLLIGNLFLHKPISDVCDAAYARLGREAYEWLTLGVISALSLAGAGLVLRRGAPGLRRPRTLLAFAALAALTVAAQRLLLVTNVELIHLPQFALLAALLLAAGLPAEAAWLAASAGGALDEGYQRLVIYAAVKNVYFDWNDIVLNALGAAWAVLLIRGGRGDAAPWLEARLRRLATTAALGALALAWWLAPPRLAATDTFPFVAPLLGRAMTGRYYHVMPASEGVATLLVIWLLVRLACSSRVRVPPVKAGGQGGFSNAIVALAALLASCAVHRPPVAPPLAASPPVAAPAAAAPPPDAAAGRAATRPPFFITFWCGPPLAQLTDARAAQIAAAGFDVIGAPCEGMVSPALNRQALDVAARHGLKLLITDPRTDQYDPAPPGWDERLAAAVREYGAHPALAGYFLVDEPGAERFADLAPVVAQLRHLDPSRLAYVNLLPDYVSPEAFGAADYRDYVVRYVTEVRPALLSVDYYPFKNAGDRDGFFATLALMREQSLAAGVPWMLIIQAMPHGPYRDPSQAEMGWQIFHALAFGARGISYFTYWTPVHVQGAAHWQFRRGLVEGGVATDKLAQAAELNGAARAIATALDDYTSLGVVDSTGVWLTPPAGGASAVPALQLLAGGPVTIGLFGAADGRRAALLVNQDYRRETRLLFGEPAERVVLPPGGAALLQ